MGLDKVSRNIRCDVFEDCRLKPTFLNPTSKDFRQHQQAAITVNSNYGKIQSRLIITKGHWGSNPKDSGIFHFSKQHPQWGIEHDRVLILHQYIIIVRILVRVLDIKLVQNHINRLNTKRNLWVTNQNIEASHKNIMFNRIACQETLAKNISDHACLNMAHRERITALEHIYIHCSLLDISQTLPYIEIK